MVQKLHYPKKFNCFNMENQNFTMPLLGDSAPEFTASTTQGEINFPADFAGKWKILFSHPNDFTPVCTSEFVTFASMKDDFEALNCQLIGISIDGLYSHIAWLRTIKEKIEYKGHKNMDVTFPLIDDISMEVAKKYGMIQPNASSTKAVRAVFFIDTENKIRAIIYYPLSLGRNFMELKRVLIALQTSDAFGVSTPADWHPGDDIIHSAPTTLDKANNHMEHPKERAMCYDWFFCTHNISKEDIFSKISKK